jgi:tripartite-type tricarboxylate transporter receptor subunit TctC
VHRAKLSNVRYSWPSAADHDNLSQEQDQEMRRIPGVCLFITALACASASGAQTYPSRPVKVILNVGPGGTGDIFIRTIGEELHKRWGQPIVVENRPGGGFIVAGRACAEAAPDGYTICVLTGETLVYN